MLLLSDLCVRIGGFDENTTGASPERRLISQTKIRFVRIGFKYADLIFTIDVTPDTRGKQPETFILLAVLKTGGPEHKNFVWYSDTKRY